MAGFLDQRLDTKITAGATGGPMVPGRVKTYLPNGKLQQSFNATMPIHKYDVSHGLRSRADFQTVLDIFYVVMFTPYVGFRFRDERDYQATQTNTTLTALGGNNWQLQRKHAFGGFTFLRDIFKPLAGVVVYRTRSGSTNSIAATVYTTTGVAVITDHVGGDTYTWSGEFDVPVTFSDDAWTASLEVSTQNLHLQSGEIKLEEIRL